MKIAQVAFGQFLALCLAFAGKGNQKMNDKGPYWLFYQDSCRILTILTFSTLILLINKKLRKSAKIPFYSYFLCAATDILGNMFLTLGYGTTASYIAVFIAQLMYPMMIIVTKILFNRSPGISLPKIIAFVVLTIICFFVNRYSAGTEAKNILKGVAYVFLSNACFIINILLQSKIVHQIGPFPYLQKANTCSFFLSAIISSLLSYKSIPKSLDSVFEFYKTRYGWLIIYTLCISTFYIIGTFYIEINGPVPFNIATLPFSAYFGLMHLISGMNYYTLLAYVTCISASIFLLYEELPV